LFSKATQTTSWPRRPTCWPLAARSARPWRPVRSRRPPSPATKRRRLCA